MIKGLLSTLKIPKDLLDFASSVFDFFKAPPQGESRPENCKLFKCETLTMDKFKQLAQKYMVPNCNEVVAIKAPENTDFVLYLTYSFNKKLLPPESNVYITLHANHLDEDVDELFGVDDIVILK